MHDLTWWKLTEAQMDGFQPPERSQAQLRPVSKTQKPAPLDQNKALKTPITKIPGPTRPQEKPSKLPFSLEGF